MYLLEIPTKKYKKMFFTYKRMYKALYELVDFDDEVFIKKLTTKGFIVIFSKFKGDLNFQSHLEALKLIK